MRISDWSADVCSSDLDRGGAEVRLEEQQQCSKPQEPQRLQHALQSRADRKSVVSGKSVSVRVDLGGRRSIKNNKACREELRATYQQSCHATQDTDTPSVK